jgi:alkanesulfonate monooxygenase SsuD/methylene tetrahydromethanopterin reductase-like flavin-dependent oxidoreductase (luciferase family)
MRAFLDTGRVEMEGRFHRYHGIFTSAQPVSGHVPLLLGAMGGPLTFRVAGEIADGVYCACSFAPEAFDYIVDNVCRGAERAGRDWRDLELCASLTCAVSEDGDSAKVAARTKAAFYLPSMPPKLVERHGVPYSEVEPVCRAFASGDVGEALALTPDDLADRFCIAGTPEEVAARIRTDVLPSGFNHVTLALADRRMALDWAGIELPDLPLLDDQVRLIGTRIVPALTAQSTS